MSSVGPCRKPWLFPQKFPMKSRVIVDFPRPFPQLVENCVEKAEFYTGINRIYCGFFQKSSAIRKKRRLLPKNTGVGMWKTPIKPCEQKNFSASNPQIPVDRFECFSTENRLKKFHNDTIRAPGKHKNSRSSRFWDLTDVFQKQPTPNPGLSNNSQKGGTSKKPLYFNDILFFHSFHPPYGYYCWYSYVLSCKVPCCQTRVRACRPQITPQAA